MTQKSFAETLDERIKAIELVADSIAQEGRNSDVHDLRILLIHTMSMLRRDPGIEAAVDDLYAAARAIVRDVAAGQHPVSRNLRFLRSALERFTARVPAVSGLADSEDSPRFRGLEAAYAVQLERSAAPEEAVAEEGERSAA